MTEITSRLSTALAGKLLLVVVALALFACQDAERLRLSCDDGNATACSNLGFMYQNGEGVTRDLARAASLYQQACDGGNTLACYNLGMFYEHGEGVPQNSARAASFYQHACDGGLARACRKQ